MRSYHTYRKLVSQIKEAAAALDAETEAYSRVAPGIGPSSPIEADVRRSTEWLTHALKSLLMATAALRDARERTTHSPAASDTD